MSCPSLVDDLTPTEREVLALLAEGASDSRIAQTLTVSEVDAQAHVSSILRKLVLVSRTQAGVWAMLEGLAPMPAEGARA